MLPCSIAAIAESPGPVSKEIHGEGDEYRNRLGYQIVKLEEFGEDEKECQVQGESRHSHNKELQVLARDFISHLLLECERLVKDEVACHGYAKGQHGREHVEEPQRLRQEV